MSDFNAQASLQAVCLRNPDALTIIAAVTSISERRLQEIHDGKGAPASRIETIVLQAASNFS